MGYFDTPVLIYIKDTIVGYVTTLKEAINICIIYPKYKWDFPPKTTDIDYKQFQQLTINNL